jgi:hypothetical protein
MALITIGSEDISIDNTAGGVILTASKVNGAGVIMATVTIETAQIRYKTDSAVTLLAGSIGHVGNIGDVIEIWGNKDMLNFKAIRTGSTSGKIAVTYQGAGG